MPCDNLKLENACRLILEAIGEDANRHGLADTPRRFAGFWREFIDYEHGKLDTAFEAIEGSQLIAVSGIKVWSLCEHHLLPFWCDVSIGYIANGKVLGLSKFARIAQKYAHRLQIQERLVSDIKKDVCELSDSEDVIVFAKGEHLCMTMRGIKSPAIMSSSSIGGRFVDPAARKEFFDMIGAAK
jgi:GTP cyclohydrolase I